MAPQLPERYQTQVRLGRDGDIEEWLATDTALDRPVLIRVLNPDAAPERVAQFIASTRAAATVEHVHLAGVFEVGESSGGGAYAAIEWNGGVSIADRLAVGETLPVGEFLPNAAGLADGLAAMHDAGIIHGAIDPAAIVFSAAHPAKLSSYGRAPRWTTPGADTAALAQALRIAVTGSSSPNVRPSYLVEGLPPSVDSAINAAQDGLLDAAGLSAALHAIPSALPVIRTAGWSWRWLIPAGLLLITAVVIAAIGLTLDVDPGSPFLFPATPPGSSSTTTASPGSTTTTLPEPPPGTLAAKPAVYDPFGDQMEHDQQLPNIIDRNPDTTWRTERYLDPLSKLKPGVGVTFQVSGAPGSIEIRASAQTRYSVYWAKSIPTDFSSWDEIGSGTVLDAPSVLQLPDRDGGIWLLWFTELPQQAEAEYFTSVSEVAFRP